MPIFKNTLDILTNPWSYEFSCENSRTPPKTNDWNMERNITVDDVILWEQLYYEPGNIGVYVAYRPYADCYLITYNLFYCTILHTYTSNIYISEVKSIPLPAYKWPEGVKGRTV
jgi:hypothetical protein